MDYFAPDPMQDRCREMTNANGRHYLVELRVARKPIDQIIEPPMRGPSDLWFYVRSGEDVYALPYEDSGAGGCYFKKIGDFRKYYIKRFDYESVLELLQQTA